VLQALLASLLVVLGSFNQIISYFIFVVVIFIALTVAALFVFRRRVQVSARFLTPGFPLTPIIFLVLIAVLLVLLGSNNLKGSVLGVGVVALGLPAYYFLFRRRFLSED